ncbi:MAG: DUF697 domain-containing protein [Saprospiraceae bacterium]|nr:DUF697 domain-containing protein [Bacteroidia bacterium]NNE16385.1 DUF697 domain-containing protein [Saprospiraceae bacterium]NNL93511.1 DUF697 domain-containing protein [Saprospiraceae bacterium]
MTESEKKAKASHSNSIIKNHMIWSMGAGFIPIPIADFFAVSAIQLDMIRQLSKVYEVNFKETEGKAVITALTGSGLARLGARAVKIIPGVGSMLGGITLAVLSGGSTYALGEVFKKHFETGGTFLDFDPSRLKKYYDEKFEKGKQMAREMEKTEKVKRKKAEEVITEVETKEESTESKAKDVVSQLKALNELKNDGVITEEEFAELKKKLFAAKL